MELSFRSQWSSQRHTARSRILEADGEGSPTADVDIGGRGVLCPTLGVSRARPLFLPTHIPPHTMSQNAIAHIPATISRTLTKSSLPPYSTRAHSTRVCRLRFSHLRWKRPRRRWGLGENYGLNGVYLDAHRACIVGSRGLYEWVTATSSPGTKCT